MKAGWYSKAITMKKLLGVVPYLVLLAVIIALVFASRGAVWQVLATHGFIGNAERSTLILAVLIMSVIIVPVFFLTFFIAIRYREDNKKAKYQPEWANNKWLELVWWGIPIVIVGTLSVLTYKTSHDLDPFKSLSSSQPPVKIQVVALQWKWLFIYPDEGVASVDEFAMPLNRPVEFTITSDAPMNSFWIPQLGGQIYAMSGMSTKLSLMADTVGNYQGSSANLSGQGHAQMNFTAKARANSDYISWLRQAKNGEALDTSSYSKLRLPSLNNHVTYYHLDDSALYASIIARYSSGDTMEGMNMSAGGTQ